MNDQKIDEFITTLDELLTRIADALDRLAPPPAVELDIPNLLVVGADDEA